MRTRKEIEDAITTYAGSFEEEFLMERQIEILLDIRDLLLAAEERTQRFENEVERIKQERNQSLNANLS